MPETAFDKYFETTDVSETAMPIGNAYCFTGLFKRGKTYNAARWNPSCDAKKTLILDAERCILKFPEYNGVKVLPLTSWVAPVDANGVTVAPSERGLYSNGQPIKAWSFKEAIALIKVMAKKGDLKNMFETVMIDTVDVLQTWAEQHYIADQNTRKKDDEQVFSIGDVAHGAAWSDARDILVTPLLELKSIVTGAGLDFIIIVHSKTTTQVANKYQRDPALRAGVANAIFGQMDAIGYVNVEDSVLPDGANNGTVYNGVQYTVSFMNSQEILTGGSRLKALVNETIPFSYKAAIDLYAQKSTKKEL